MDCGNARERMSEYQDRTLRADEAKAMAGHLAECPECAAVAGSLAAVRERLRGLPPDPAPPELFGRVQAVIRKETPEEPRGSGTRSLFSRRALPLEVAAAVMLFAAVYWYRSEAPPSPSAVVHAPADAPGRQVATERSAATGRGVRVIPETAPEAPPAPNVSETEKARLPKTETLPMAAKTRSWSPADLPAAPAIRASTDSERILPAEAPPSPESGAARRFAAPPSRVLRPSPYGREVLLEIGPETRNGVEERIAAAARRLGGVVEPAERGDTGPAEGAATVRAILPEPAAEAFLAELDRIGKIPPEGKPAAVDLPAGPRAGTVAYTVRVRIR